MTSSAPIWLSILIPVYNLARYLTGRVASVLAQADDGVEVVLLDDCSTDGSAACIQTLARRWPGRLRLLEHPHNQGLSAARNTMIDAAQGEYLWFLGSDDKLLPGAIPGLRRIVDAYARPDVVLCDYTSWRESYTFRQRIKGELHRRAFIGPTRRLSRDNVALVHGILMAGELHAWSKIAKRALWQRHQLRFPPGRYFEDLATMPRMGLCAESFYYEPEPWVAYRQRSDSILATMTPRKILDWSASLAEFRKDLDASPLATHPKLGYALAHACARNLNGLLRQLKQHLNHAPAHARGELAQTLLRDFHATSPLSPDALQRAYLQRMALSRRRRLARTLRQLQDIASAR